MATKKSIVLNLQNAHCITCNTDFKMQTTLKKDIKIDVCSNCHPFYQKGHKFESKAGRMERFRKIAKKTEELQSKIKNK